MISIKLESTSQSVYDRINLFNEYLNSNDPALLLSAANAILSLVAYRIHTDGKKASGADIGTYNNSYMKVRLANNRTDSRRMVFSLTRQMENDFTAVESGEKVGLGFNNSHNFDKATWLEEMFPGVYSLSNSEALALVDVLSDYINGIFE